MSVGDQMAMTALYHFAAKYAMQQPVALNIRLSKELPRDLVSFGELCARHNILDLYLWLGIRFPKYFIEMDLCLEQKRFATQQIEATLRRGLDRSENTHAVNYLKLRDKLAGKLPASEYPHIRDLAVENLSKVPRQLHYVSTDRDGNVVRGGGESGRGHGHRGRQDRRRPSPEVYQRVGPAGSALEPAAIMDDVPGPAGTRSAPSDASVVRKVLGKYKKVAYVGDAAASATAATTTTTTVTV